MVIYEVNLSVDKEIFQDYSVWLQEHVEEMLQFPGFLSATIMRPEIVEDGEQKEMVVQYQLEGRDDLERYFNEFASGMREKGIQLFSGRFSAKRRILEVESAIHK